VRADRSNKRVWFITLSPPSVPVNNGFFSYFFSPSLPPHCPPECYITPLPPPHQTFRPLSSSFRRIFILRRFPFLQSLYFGKTPPVVSCCRRAIKDNRNISVFFLFPRCRETFSSGRNPTVCLGRQHNSIPLYVRRATIAQCVFVPMNNILSYFVSHNISLQCIGQVYTYRVIY